MRGLTLRLIVMLCVVPLLPWGCSSCGEGPEGTKPEAAELPSLELRDDTENLLLTWVDAKGDFHVVQKPADVPEEGRDNVRVVVADREEGTAQLFYVADLTRKNADGSYSVRTLPRSEWELMAQKRRDTTMAGVLPPSSGSAAGTARPDPVAPSTRLTAILYGASWCSACREAARYLRQRGVTVTERDIEADSGARDEMTAKLKRAGLPVTGSIPVIDIRGKMVLGFHKRDIDRAITSGTTGTEL